MSLPEIRIDFAWLLWARESKVLAGDKGVHSYEEYKKRTAEYRKEWRRHEDKIVTALQDALGVTFYKSVIDVSCAPWFIPKSDPLIINFRTEPDEFVDVLAHELCHVLLLDNNILRLRDDEPVVDSINEVWHSLFGKTHDINTLAHIPVHALSKFIYLDILKEPRRLDRDIALGQENIKYDKDGVYSKAWDYVQKHDYKKIIADLKDSYQEMAA